MIAHPTIHLPNDVILSPVGSARNLGVIFYSNLTFSDHISAVSKSCLYHIRDLRRISAIPSISYHSVWWGRFPTFQTPCAPQFTL